MSVLLLGFSSTAADTLWIGGVGDWDEAGNWSNGVPLSDTEESVARIRSGTAFVSDGVLVDAGGFVDVFVSDTTGSSGV